MGNLELTCVSILILLVMSFVVPWLFSQQSDFAVISGFLLIFLSAYAVIRQFIQCLKKRKSDNEKIS